MKCFAQRKPKGAVGVPPYDYVLAAQKFFIFTEGFINLSDDQTEYQINDRMSFSCAFLGLGLGDRGS